MIIEKKQTDPDNCIFRWHYFSCARQGLKKILEQPLLRGRKILIPAYIGHSTREGSGVFDPIAQTKKEYVFYRMDGSLNIDEADLKKKMSVHVGQILLLIHYFGFKDKNIDAIKKSARVNGMVIIEDFAHALFTFYNDPQQDFDYAVFSLHKMLAFADGGLVLCQGPLESTKQASDYDLFRYDFPLIAKRRRENYEYILQTLKARKGQNIRIMFPVLDSFVPQSFPILLAGREIRDHLYFAMNEAGYGVVSLYHELIGPVDSSFLCEHEISDRILNLPVHQDAGQKQLEGMLQLLFSLLKKGHEVRV